MKHQRLRNLIFLALCCDMGLFSKRLVAPLANILTDWLHIPGGIGTSFSLMFLVVAAMLAPRFGCAAVMGAVQSVLALLMGMSGSMGVLAPIGYIVPGIVIDCVVFAGRRLRADSVVVMAAANMLSAAAASLTANVIVFHLRGVPLLLYVAMALTSGAVCGLLADLLSARLRPVIRFVTNDRGREIKA